MSGETYPRFEREALEGDLAARRGERELPRRAVTLGPMDPGDVVEPREHNCRFEYCEAPTGECPNPE